MQVEKGIAVVRRIIEELRDVHLVKPGPEPSESTFQWLLDWFTRDDNVNNGAALTPLMWLPQAYWVCLATCIKGENAYTAANALDLGLFVKLEAMGAIEVQTGTKRVPTAISVGPANVAATHEIYKIYTPMQRGETIVVPALWAIENLYRWSRMGHEPKFWDASSATPSKVMLREVGYELRGTVQQMTAPPPQQRKRRETS